MSKWVQHVVAARRQHLAERLAALNLQFRAERSLASDATADIPDPREDRERRSVATGPRARFGRD